MIISEKEKIILNCLLNNNEALSIKEISKITKIKERTLYREIKNLEYFLLEKNLKLKKEKSKYKIIGNINNIDTSIIDTNLEQGYSASNKINLILCALIFSEETSIKEISEKFYLSYNTVANTLHTIEKILVDYKIKLIRKKGAGIFLVGEELDKRILIISILLNEITDDEFFSILNNTDNFSTNPFFKFLDINFLKKVFSNNRQLEIFKVYTDTSIKKILISLNIAFLRCNIKIAEEKNISSNSEIEKEYAKDLIYNIRNIVNIADYSNVELFLLKILKTCKLIEQVTYFNDKYSYTLIYKVNSLIKNVSEKSSINFSDDKNLVNGLIVHIEASIKRYQLKLVEENNDLQEFVLKNYNELYLIIKSELLELFAEINFNATELSYIVLHFASSYEQIYRENFVRALVICSSGIGSSKILGSLIRKNIPEIKNVEYSIPTKLTNYLINNYDIIISTIKLNEDIDYILVPTILRDEDVEKIKNKLLSVRSFNKQNNFFENSNTKITTKDINTIIKNTIINNIDNYNNSLEFLLKNALKVVNIKQKNIIVSKLIDRHKKSSVVIPNTNIALFHTLDDNITEPFLIITKLKNKLSIYNVLGELENVTNIFVMVSPNKNNYTELLGLISIAILDDDIFKKAVKSNNIEFIKTKIELIMTKHIINI